MRISALIFALCISCFSSTAFAVSQDECKGADGEKLIQCIEASYDRCDGSWGIRSYITAQCAWARGEIADRKIKAAEKAILGELKKAGATQAALNFVASQKKWRSFVESYCRFVREANAVEVFRTDPTYLLSGECLRRQKEDRARELQQYENADNE